MKFNKNIFILVTSQYSTSSINNIVKHIKIKFILPIIVKFSDVNSYGNMITTKVYIIIISSISIMIIILKVLTSVLNCRIIKKYQLLLNKYHNIKTLLFNHLSLELIFTELSHSTVNISSSSSSSSSSLVLM